MMINILIADDHHIFRQGLIALLREQPGFCIVGEAGTGKAVLDLAIEMRPHVVILDVELPEMDGIEAAAAITAALPDTRIIALSMYNSPFYQQRMKDASAAFYLHKSQPIAALVAAIHDAVGDRTQEAESAEECHPILDTMASAVVTLNDLSERERDVLRMLAEGRRIAGIAESLSISPKTVETYRARIQQKLKIKDLSGLVRFAIRAGLVAPET